MHAFQGALVKLFDDMTRVEKLNHIEQCLNRAWPAVQELTCLADIVDVWDHWAPYLISRLRELESLQQKTVIRLVNGEEWICCQRIR